MNYGSEKTWCMCRVVHKIACGLMCCLIGVSLWAQQTAVDSLVAKGVDAETMGLMGLAQQYYTQAQQEDPASAIPYYHLGLLYERRCLYPQAIHELRQALTYDSAMASTYEHLVACMIEARQFDDMTELTHLCEKAIELNPSSASAYASMAMINSHNKNYTNALTWAKRAVQADPQ